MGSSLDSYKSLYKSNLEKISYTNEKRRVGSKNEIEEYFCDFNLLF